MANLYYGNGDCSIQGDNIRGVEIEYTGYIKDLVKNTSPNFKLVGNNERIIIFPIGEGYLEDLFSYSGSLKIVSSIVAGINGEPIHCYIKRVMDYSELLATNAEDMTTLSEDLNANYNSTKKMSTKNSNSSHMIENIESEGRYYLADGSVYSGLIHCHLADSAVMTGGTHTEDSQDLYIQPNIDGKPYHKLTPTRRPNGGLAIVELRANQKKKRYRG